VFPSRVLPSTELLIIPRQRVRVVPLTGRNFTYQDLGLSGDNQKGQVVGEYTVEVHHPDAMARLHVVRITEFDLVCALRMPQFFAHPINARLRMLWNQDLLLPGLAPTVMAVAWALDAIAYVSDYHRRQWEDQPRTWRRSAG
jgi:hypothetical protein